MSEGKKVHEKVEGMSVGKKRKVEGKKVHEKDEFQKVEAKQMKVEKPKASVKVKTIEVKKDETSKGKKVIKPRAKNPNNIFESSPLIRANMAPMCLLVDVNPHLTYSVGSILKCCSFCHIDSVINFLANS